MWSRHEWFQRTAENWLKAGLPIGNVEYKHVDDLLSTVVGLLADCCRNNISNIIANENINLHLVSIGASTNMEAIEGLSSAQCSIVTAKVRCNF